MPWSDFVIEKRGIRQISRKMIIDKVLKPLESEWVALILDQTAMNIFSTSFTTEEMLSQSVALIEMINIKRDPLPYLSALYVMCPNRENVNFLLGDENNSLYKRVHLVFLSAVPDEIFEILANSINPFTVQTFTELNLLFLPRESQVFLLDEQSFFSIYFNSYRNLSYLDVENAVKSLATFFCTLGEIPLIRYRRDFIKNLILAEALQQQLNCLQDRFSPSEIKPKQRCQLLILDRGFDCISPLLHEFTFEAMAYDLLNIEDDIYEYHITEGNAAGDKNCVPLTEEDPLWAKLRHEHIANVAKIIQNKIETDTLMDKTSIVRKKGVPDLSATIKQFIAGKKNETFYSYRHMANECMKIYCGGINITSQLQQGKCMPIDKSGIEESESFDPVYKQSRWKPLIKDIILTCVKGKLSEDDFPFLNECDVDRIATVQRTNYWCVDKKSEHNSQLVIFIAGGVTYSEICCVYEVMKQYSGWDIYIGGDSILTPSKFIKKLAELPCLITESV